MEGSSVDVSGPKPEHVPTPATDDAVAQTVTGKRQREREKRKREIVSLSPIA